MARESVENRLWGTSDNTNLDISDLVFKVEATTGELIVVAYGKDSGGNIDPLRTNASQQLQIEVVPLERPIQKDSEAILAAGGSALLDGSAVLTSGGVYEVTMNVVNVDGANSATVDLGVDYDAGGGLSAAEYFFKTVPVPAGGQTGNFTLTMSAADDIWAEASAAGDLVLFFIRIIRVA